MTLIAGLVTIVAAIIIGVATGSRRGTRYGVGAAFGVITAGVIGYVIILASTNM